MWWCERLSRSAGEVTGPSLVRPLERFKEFSRHGLAKKLLQILQRSGLSIGLKDAQSMSVNLAVHVLFDASKKRIVCGCLFHLVPFEDFNICNRVCVCHGVLFLVFQRSVLRKHFGLFLCRESFFDGLFLCRESFFDGL